jgi:universal stress protein A
MSVVHERNQGGVYPYGCKSRAASSAAEEPALSISTSEAESLCQLELPGKFCGLKYYLGMYGWRLQVSFFFLRRPAVQLRLCLVEVGERAMKSLLPEKSRQVPSNQLDRAEGSAVAQREGDQAAVSCFRLSRILVPTDFSPFSRAALHYAISLGRVFGAQISLLHVVPMDFSEGEFSLINYPFAKERLLQEAGQQLNEWLKRESQGPVRATTLVRLGPPVAEIARVAAELGADLIVLATHGHTGVSHLFLGSTAERVVRYAPCPVLTVREKETGSKVF